MDSTELMHAKHVIETQKQDIRLLRQRIAALEAEITLSREHDKR